MAPVTYDDSWYAVHADESMDREDEEAGDDELWEDAEYGTYRERSLLP